MNSLTQSQHKAAKLHQPVLDGIRGIAILAVLLTHGVTVSPGMPTTAAGKFLAYALTPGWAGVDLFFVLSGFLITGILLATKRAENYFTSFYARRFLRISPIYYLSITVVFLAATQSPWLNSILPSWPLRRVSFYFYLQNVWYFLNHGSLGYFLGHFWSLAVEEQFYLVWPILVLLLPERFLFWLCPLGMALALPLRTFLYFRDPDDFRVMMLTTSRIDGLLLGAACAIYMHRSRRPLPWRWIAAAFVAGSLIIGYIALWHRREFRGTSLYMSTIGITGFALLSAALVAASQHKVGWLDWLLSAGWLRAFGKYSYGIYVYHLMLYLVLHHIAQFVLGVRFPLSTPVALLYLAGLIALTFFLAKLSYVFFESKFLALKDRFEPQYREIPVQSPAAEIAV